MKYRSLKQVALWADVYRGIGMSRRERLERWAELLERQPNVGRFVGDPSRSRELLGWTADIAVRNGVRALVSDFRTELENCSAPFQATDPGRDDDAATSCRGADRPLGPCGGSEHAKAVTSARPCSGWPRD
jgi:hypothetical protein